MIEAIVYNGNTGSIIKENNNDRKYYHKKRKERGLPKG